MAGSIYMQVSKQKKVLHLTAHLGGGVGKVLSNYLLKAKENRNFHHQMMSLAYTEEKVLRLIKKTGFPYRDNMFNKHELIIKAIEESDIVLVHWWNHPLMYDFLIRNKLPPSRIIFWSHVAGFHPPQVFTKEALEYPDQFVFTTPISLETDTVKKLTSNQRKSLKVVLTTGGVERTESIRPQKHPGFNVGYIGTVDYAKIHPNFLDICRRIDIPEVKFIICGGSNEKKLKIEARKMGIANKLIFTGQVEDISKYLELFDVFGYPLVSNHYGTCDQTLIESMSAGVVPVVYANRMEKFMVKNKVTGFVVKNEDEYINAISKLHKNPTLREKMSQETRKHAQKAFSIEKMVEDWEKVFERVLSISKSPKSWNNKKEKILPKDIFIESLGSHAKHFKDYCSAKTKEERIKIIKKIARLGELPAWQSESKGTVHNYNYFLPGDHHLSFWSKVMKKKVGLTEHENRSFKKI